MHVCDLWAKDKRVTAFVGLFQQASVSVWPSLELAYCRWGHYIFLYWVPKALKSLPDGQIKYCINVPNHFIGENMALRRGSEEPCSFKTPELCQITRQSAPLCCTYKDQKNEVHKPTIPKWLTILQWNQKIEFKLGSVQTRGFVRNCNYAPFLPIFDVVLSEKRPQKNGFASKLPKLQKMLDRANLENKVRQFHW